MNWQAKTRELIEQRHVSVDGLGRAIGEKGRSMRNWLRVEKPTKPLSELRVTQAVADYFAVDVLWLRDPATEFPSRPRPTGGGAASPGQTPDVAGKKTNSPVSPEGKSRGARAAKQGKAPAHADEHPQLLEMLRALASDPKMRAYLLGQYRYFRDLGPTPP